MANPGQTRRRPGRSPGRGVTSLAPVDGRGGLLRNRDYVGWLVGETLSSLGSSLSTFAYPVLVLFATHSAAKTGIVAAAANVGSLTTLLVGGALADRWSRRSLLLAGPLVQAVVVGSVAVAVAAGHVVLAHVAAAGFIDGVVLGITRGAENAALRRLVSAEQYAGAAAQLHARDMGVRVIGPSLGGVLLTAARALPFVIDAISYLASVVGVLVIRRPLGPDIAERAEREPLRSAVVTGLRYLVRDPYLRFVAWWAAMMNMLGSGLMLLVILLVRERGGSATVIGAAEAIGAAGGVIGAIASGYVIARFAGRWLVVALSWCLAFAAFTMAVVRSPWGIGAALALVSVVAVPLNVTLATYEAQLIPDALIGRVTTSLDLAANGLRWLAPITIGVIVGATSAPTAAVVWGAAFSVVALVALFNGSLHVLDEPIEQVRR